MVTNLLDWVKLQANELKLPSDQPFELPSLSSECVQLVQHLLHKKPVSLTTKVDLSANVVLCGAPFHLKQAGEPRLITLGDSTSHEPAINH